MQTRIYYQTKYYKHLNNNVPKENLKLKYNIHSYFSKAAALFIRQTLSNCLKIRASKFQSISGC